MGQGKVLVENGRQSFQDEMPSMILLSVTWNIKPAGVVQRAVQTEIATKAPASSCQIVAAWC